MEKKSMTNNQLIFLSLMCASGLSVGMSPNDLVVVAKNDLWIVVLISVPINISLCYFYFYMAKQMKGKYLAQFIDSLFSKKVATTIKLFYLAFFASTTSLTNRVMGNLIQLELIPETPMWVILTPFIFVAFYGVLKGFPTIARTAEILVPVMTIMFAFTISMLIKKAHITNYLPILEHGFSPIFKSTLTFVSYTGLSLIGIFSFFPSERENIDGCRKFLIIGILFATSMNLLVAGFSVLIVGSKIASLYHYPGYLLAREVVVGNILERSDAFIVILWFFAVFVNSCIYSFTTYKMSNSIFHFKSRRTSALAFALIISYYSQIELFNVLNLHHFFKDYWFYISVTFGLIIPIMLLWKNKRNKNTPEKFLKKES